MGSLQLLSSWIPSSYTIALTAFCESACCGRSAVYFYSAFAVAQRMGKHKKRKHGSEDDASAGSGARTGLLTSAAVGPRSCNQTDTSPRCADEPTQKRQKKEHKKDKRKEEKRKEEKRLLKEAKKFLKNSAPAELLYCRIAFQRCAIPSASCGQAELAAGSTAGVEESKPDNAPLAAGTSINTLTEDDYFVRPRAAQQALAWFARCPDTKSRCRQRTQSSQRGFGRRTGASSTSSRPTKLARSSGSLWTPGTRASCPRASMRACPAAA